jgi:hypothetical protein
MSENIRLSQGANFPWDIVGRLYSDDPRTMFTPDGARLIGKDAGRVFGNGDVTLEQLHGFDSTLGNAIRMEQGAISAPGAGGNPQLLRNLTKLHGVVSSAIDDSAKAAGNQLALRSALDATRQAYGNFVTGGLSHVLSEQGGAANAPAAIARYLGSSDKAIQRKAGLQQAIAQRTGGRGSPGLGGRTPAGVQLRAGRGERNPAHRS